ncbi:hypothetical protein PYCC9005_004958 [Savitreella phatthalungensis]
MDWATLGASVVSSVCSRVVGYPIDTIAIRKQTGRQRPVFPPGVPLVRSARELYRGLGASIVLTTPAVSLYLCTYRAVKERLEPVYGETTLTYVASGTAAEVISSWLWTPLEVVKARMQVTSGEPLRKQLGSILQNEGVSGFYRGYWLGLAMFIPYNAVWWSIYEHGKPHTRRLFHTSDPALQGACSSGLATLVATGLLHPADVLKTTYQVAATRAADASLTIAQTARTLTSFKRAYAGFAIRLMCSLPASIISMAVFELVRPDSNVHDQIES